MCSDLASEGELVIADVESDHLGRRKGPEDLDRKMAKAAHADDDGGGAWDELDQGWLDCVVGRQSGVGQWDATDWIEVAQR